MIPKSRLPKMVKSKKRKDWTFRQYINAIKDTEYIINKTHNIKCKRDFTKYLSCLKQELKEKE